MGEGVIHGSMGYSPMRRSMEALGRFQLLSPSRGSLQVESTCHVLYRGVAHVRSDFTDAQCRRHRLNEVAYQELA